MRNNDQFKSAAATIASCSFWEKKKRREENKLNIANYTWYIKIQCNSRYSNKYAWCSIRKKEKLAGFSHFQWNTGTTRLHTTRYATSSMPSEKKSAQCHCTFLLHPLVPLKQASIIYYVYIWPIICHVTR